jgi:phospholipid transport system substrate-binding protein
MNIKRLIWIGLLGIALIAGIAHAIDTDTPTNLVKTKLSQVTNILADNSLSLEKKQAKILDVVVPAFDLPLMAKLTLGKKHWNTIPKAKRQEFSSLYTTLLKRSYLGKVTLYSNERIDYKPPKTVKNKVYVPTELVSKGKMVPVTYKLYKSKNGWKIYDAVISGTSIVLSHRIEYDALLRNGSIDDLLAKLRQSLK